MIKLSRLLPVITLFASLLFISACSKTPQISSLDSDATILAFGDSLTYGTGAGEAESYPAELARLTGRRVVNAGIPGEVSAAGLKRLPQLLDRENPSLLILCHGGNDLLGRLDSASIADNLRAMIRLALDRKISVLLVAVPLPELTLKPPVFYEELSKEFNIPIELNALSRILGKGALKSDYIHPNAKGYSILAEAIEKQLKNSGALKR